MKHSEDRNILDRFVLRTGMLSLARVIQVLLTLGVFWLYSLRLQKALYGNYQKIFVLIGFCSSLLALGLPLLIASLPATQLRELISGIWKRTRKFYLLLFAGITIFILLFLPILSLTTRFLLLILTLTGALYSVAEIFTIKRGRNRRVFLINLIYSFVFAGIHLYFLFRTVFLLDALLAALIVAGVLRILFAGITGKEGEGDNNPREDQRHGGKTKPATGGAEIEVLYTRQWLYLSLNQALESFSGNIDNLFLLWLLTAPFFAVYFNGSYEIPVSGILVSAAGTFISVQVNQAGAGNAGILSLFRRVCLLLACLLFPLFFFLQTNASLLFAWAFHGKYNDAVPIFLISTWILPLRIANYTVILQNKLRSERVFQGSLLGVIAKILFCLLFYSICGLRGVAAAMVAGTGMQIVFYLYHSARTLETPLFSIMPFRKLLLFFILCGLLFVAGQWLVTKLAPGSGVVYPSLLLAGITGISLLVYYPQARKGL